MGFLSATYHTELYFKCVYIPWWSGNGIADNPSIFVVIYNMTDIIYVIVISRVLGL